jgi:hypothetical protein
VDEQTLAEEARELARRLSSALAASAMPDEQKAAWAALIPEMRLDQLSRFSVILDSFLSQAAKNDVANEAKKLKLTLEKYAAIQAQTDSTFMSDVANMVQELRAAETKSVQRD